MKDHRFAPGGPLVFSWFLPYSIPVEKLQAHCCSHPPKTISQLNPLSRFPEARSFFFCCETPKVTTLPFFFSIRSNFLFFFHFAFPPFSSFGASPSLFFFRRAFSRSFLSEGRLRFFLCGTAPAQQTPLPVFLQNFLPFPLASSDALQLPFALTTRI